MTITQLAELQAAVTRLDSLVEQTREEFNSVEREINRLIAENNDLRFQLENARRARVAADRVIPPSGK